MTKRSTSKKPSGPGDPEAPQIDMLTLASLVRSALSRPLDRPAARAAAETVRPVVIAFFAAHSEGAAPLLQGAECADLTHELMLAPFCADFRVESRWATTIDELMRHLNVLDPDIVHISAHGYDGELALQDERGNVQTVSPRALAKLIRSATNRVRVVFLNVCNSAAHARALCKFVDAAVAMRGNVTDHAARLFAARFYGALGNRKSVANAVEQGRAKLTALELQDDTLPICVPRKGVDTDSIVFSAAPEIAPHRAS